MGKLGTKILIGLTTYMVAAGVMLAGVTSCFNSKQEELKAQEKFTGISHLMSTSDYGTPLTLPIDESPIAVVLQNFTEQEKQDAINAINRLDEISENVNYTILEKDDFAIKQKITITNNVDLEKMYPHLDHSLGVTEYKIDHEKATIKYPIYISIDEDCKDIYDTEGVSLMSYVLKHEMMHTLGFADMYSKDYLDKTVMYYTVENGMEINDYSEFDEKNIRQLYDEGSISVKRSDKMEYTAYTKEEDDTMER